MSVSPFSFCYYALSGYLQPDRRSELSSDNSSTLATAIVGSNSNPASVTQRVTYDHSSDWILLRRREKYSAKAISINNFSSERVDSKGLYGRWRLQVIGSCLSLSCKYQLLLREMILNQQRNSRPAYGKKELTYTPYNDVLIGLIRSGE